MQTIPIAGTGRSVSFYTDDTIDLVRQSIALAVNSHPDRLFMEVKTTLPKEYYATNPQHWTELFFRMSTDGATIPADTLKTYITQKRPGALMNEKAVTKEEWDSYDESLKPLFDPETDFDEWRIVGVDVTRSFVLPLPARDLKDIPERSRPIPQTQSLFETLHPYPVTEFRVFSVPDTASNLVTLNYFPRFRPDTPTTIEPLRSTIEASRAQFAKLLSLDVPKHEKVAIVRAKWYIPLISTQFTAPRTRFEQIFYGLTVSKTTPYIGYFTAKTETMRHKFYVEDPKTKVPVLEMGMLKGWLSNTMPQRRRPTLLLYRGSSRTSFDRIAITDKDITIDVRREKDSKETLEQLRDSMAKWIQTMDAVVPFLVQSDLDEGRWNMGELSVLATYAKEINTVDMRRFPCLQSIFGVQNEVFRLLRAEIGLPTWTHVSADEARAYQIMTQDDAEQSATYLAEQMGISTTRAADLLNTLATRAEEVNYERTLKAYPTIKFSPKEVIVKFVTNLDRTLHYADILRHVLTSDAADVNDVCPRQMGRVAPVVSIPQQEIQLAVEDAADDDFNALLGFEPTEEEKPPAEEAVSSAAPEKKVKVISRAMGTYNYFNTRAKAFDPDTFDQTIYPSKCDKPKQVVILTAKDKARMGSTYNYDNAAPEEKLELNDPDGTVICPPYWCMRDEIPLREDQLVTEKDGELHCPVCGGKVRTTDKLDTVEFSVIKRDTVAKYPDFLKQVSSINKRNIPCCYQKPRATVAVLAPKENDATYILDATSSNIPGLRMAYLSPDLASRLGVSTDYAKSVKGGRITSDGQDVFRVGLGRPSKTLPILFDDKTPILRPRDAKTQTMQCSFFRTWPGRGIGDTSLDKIISSIDQAYQNGELSLLEELEYVTTFLKCEIIRVDTQSGQVVCGFWSETVGPASRTIVILDKDILCSVTRKKATKGYKIAYTADLRKAPFAGKIYTTLKEKHTRACAINAPVIGDAVQELQLKSKAAYQVILDPFGRIQAAFVPGEIILPVQPTNTRPDAGVTVRSGYADIKPEERPKAETARAFLADTRNDMFKVRSNNQDASGQIVELELRSGFRIPVQPEDPKTQEDPTEIVETVRTSGEDMLVNGAPNAEDAKLATDISYSSEIYEFLMFSLSKDIQTDDYADLRRAIEKQKSSLLRRLEEWFKLEAYEDNTKSPVEFVNKVRTPCGQFRNKDTCNKSSLCGWKVDKSKGVCKIRVKPIVDKDEVLRRMAKTLRENDKQRALVLDGRLSPFFSTILYLELPHELITTTI